jgi:copper oxidase (laccase) domain-containing protein
MQAAYGSDARDVLAAIGPSIGPQSYEVGNEVMEQAAAKLPDGRSCFTYPHGVGARPHFDLWQANAGQLIAAGVRAAHIEISGIDTAQRTDDFYSYRAEAGRCGLFGMTAWLCRPT